MLCRFVETPTASFDYIALWTVNQDPRRVSLIILTVLTYLEIPLIQLQMVSQCRRLLFAVSCVWPHIIEQVSRLSDKTRYVQSEPTLSSKVMKSELCLFYNLREWSRGLVLIKGYTRSESPFFHVFWWASRPLASLRLTRVPPKEIWNSDICSLVVFHIDLLLKKSKDVRMQCNMIFGGGSSPPYPLSSTSGNGSLFPKIAF